MKDNYAKKTKGTKAGAPHKSIHVLRVVVALDRQSLSAAFCFVRLLENGRYNPSLKLAMDIAKVFHVSVEELFEFVDNE